MHTVAFLADPDKGNPVVGFLIVVGIVLFFAAWWVIDREWHPNRVCRPCGGSGRRWSSLRSGAWGEHRACSGTGKRSR